MNKIDVFICERCPGIRIEDKHNDSTVCIPYNEADSVGTFLRAAAIANYMDNLDKSGKLKESN